MNKICKNCIYWIEDRGTNIGECINASMNSNSKFDRGNELSVIITDDIELEFYTGENFGCIHFKKR